MSPLCAYAFPRLYVVAVVVRVHDGQAGGGAFTGASRMRRDAAGSAARGAVAHGEDGAHASA